MSKAEELAKLIDAELEIHPPLSKPRLAKIAGIIEPYLAGEWQPGGAIKIVEAKRDEYQSFYPGLDNDDDWLERCKTDAQVEACDEIIAALKSALPPKETQQ